MSTSSSCGLIDLETLKWSIKLLEILFRQSFYLGTRTTVLALYVHYALIESWGCNIEAFWTAQVLSWPLASCCIKQPFCQSFVVISDCLLMLAASILPFDFSMLPGLHCHTRYSNRIISLFCFTDWLRTFSLQKSAWHCHRTKGKLLLPALKAADCLNDFVHLSKFFYNL